MSQYITTSNPPMICGVLSCDNDAHVTIYTGNGELIGICPDCLDDLFALQSGVMMPEQRGNVTVLHSHHRMPGGESTTSIEASE